MECFENASLTPLSTANAQRTLAEMLFDCPLADQEHFRELGDGYVCMPLGTMEKFLYPTLRICKHLNSNKRRYEHIPGGVMESMIVYSFIHQGGGAPKIELNTVNTCSTCLHDTVRLSTSRYYTVNLHV